MGWLPRRPIPSIGINLANRGPAREPTTLATLKLGDEAAAFLSWEAEFTCARDGNARRPRRLVRLPLHRRHSHDQLARGDRAPQSPAGLPAAGRRR